MKNKIILLYLLTIILSGCYKESIKYKIGLGTRLIQGSISEKNGSIIPSDSFIIVIEYYSRFIQFEKEPPIYVPKARIVFPQKNGNFKINFDLKATSIDLAFISSGYKMHLFSFDRQIGIGNLTYNVELLKSDFWKNEFFIQIRPFLENFILEQRYEMPDSQQLFLGEWIANVKTYFLKKNKNS